MDKDVVLLCPDCQTIVDGVGSGDPTDLITCQKCNKEFKARLTTIKYKNSPSDKCSPIHINGKALYIPVDIEVF